MTLRQLKLLAILAPLLFLGAVELVRQVIAPDLFAGWPGHLLLAGIVLLGTLFFAEAIFGVVARLQTRLAQQNRELLALHDAGLDILGELDLESVLQQVVDRARELVGARYGALSLCAAIHYPQVGKVRERPWRGASRGLNPPAAAALATAL